MKRSLAGLAAVVAVSSAAASAPAASAYAAHYTDQTTVSRALEARGIYVGSRHLAVDAAACLGLRRYGVRTGSRGDTTFHRFTCYFDGADNRFYRAQLSTITGPSRGHWFWHVLSVGRGS